MTPAVSVLLPYRQAAATIEEAAASVLDQRGVELELILIDDGSSDDGPARMDRLATRHRGVRHLSTPGRGIAMALEAGRAVAAAPLIGRMDADDVCHPDRLRLQREALLADPGLAAVGTQVEAFPDSAVGEGLRRYVSWQNSLVTPEDHARELFVESPLCHPSVVLRREDLALVGGWREVPWPEDYDLWLRLDAEGRRMAKVPSVLLRWRHQAGRVTFADPRCGLDRLRAAKAPHLARRLRQLHRPLVVWGAGPTGRRMARALEGEGLRAQRFVDIDPRKLGRRARDLPITPPESLRRGEETVLVAVGVRGARALIRAHLAPRGFIEGQDYLFAA